jgi:hypothetical protein
VTAKKNIFIKLGFIIRWLLGFYYLMTGRVFFFFFFTRCEVQF